MSSTHISTIPPIPATPAPLHIRTDPHAGRKYHASTALPENTDLLGKYSPYSYTIWKRFRNEVCAECWRYDGGRRSFLTRRDDEGLDGPSTSGATHQRPSSSLTAGLYFCDARCQSEWIAREGVEAVDLLRQLEAARQKKAKSKPKSDARAQEGEADVEMTQEVVERAWAAVRDKERSPKEVRRWRDLQLEDYEADMARYVLLALHRCHREQCNRGRTSHHAAASQPEGPIATNASDNEPSEWQTFTSLQINELQLLKACPQILEHQTRIYQLLKGRFGSRAAASSVASSRSSSVSAPSRNGAQPHTDNARTREDARPDDGASSRSSQSRQGDSADLADLVTIENVRTILGVDPGNSFGVWEVPLMEESECLGFAVYPTASFFNHHCAPNVRKVREGRALRFLTTRAVEAGEELCISYGHVDEMDWKTRQKELLEGWYFECRCSRCTAEAEQGSRT
ncbi:SET domain-containing protein [Trametes cingulata]|nr:SET domain-containing protein [Trametes cingulata]